MTGPRQRKVAIVGCPNVGKSVLFGLLTGSYVSVSNYPGTTVEVARGFGRWGGEGFEVADTPGLYSLSCITEEERAARRLLLEERPDWLVHVVDGKNLGRMLPLTLQLVEAGFPVLLVVNMLDEARAAGLDIDVAYLGAKLGLPVVGASLIRGEGLKEIKGLLLEEPPGARRPSPVGGGGPPASGEVPGVLFPVYDEDTEKALTELAGRLRGDYGGMAPRAVAALMIQGDLEIIEAVRDREGGRWPAIAAVLDELAREPAPGGTGRRAQAGRPEGAPDAGPGRRAHSPQLIRHRIPLALHHQAAEIAADVTRHVRWPRPRFGETLGDLLLRPAFGLPVLAAVIYFGLYRFVGGFGAGALVDTLDRVLFLRWANPWLNTVADSLFAQEAWRELFAHEYGLLTLGLRYAVAIVLPIVGTFFVAFAILEDSGYLPRLALLVDRLLKPLGLSGRALIPLALGLGCGTMATLVTRTLETKRERVLATFLLALGVPCSAQLGVVLGVLSGRAHALAIWGTTVVLVLVAGGTAAARLVPGRAAPFFMEVPPLRLPSLRNIWRKTTARMVWYFKEILPVFLAASVVIWFGRLVGLFPAILTGLASVCRWLGLPREASLVFLFGFLRRDYGAAGLYDLAPNLPDSSLVVAAATLTLFVPCLAQTVLMFKERGARAALVIVGVVFPAAIAGGFVLSRLLAAVGGGAW